MAQTTEELPKFIDEDNEFMHLLKNEVIEGKTGEQSDMQDTELTRKAA